MIMDTSHLFVAFLFFFFTGSKAAVFTLQNRCNQTIWPGILSGTGHPLLMNGGVKLRPNEAKDVAAPTGWPGRFWARTGCVFDPSGKQGNCTTGDCGGILECGGAGGAPAVSLAEFTLDSPQDFYDVSLVDGYNLPVSIVPSGGRSGNCSAVRCVSDVNGRCPEALKIRGSDGAVVACKSACLAFGQAKYCCTGTYNSPDVCKPSNYSVIFKKACPSAYSYPYDDLTSTFTCQGANYSIIFC